MSETFTPLRMTVSQGKKGTPGTLFLLPVLSRLSNYSGQPQVTSVEKLTIPRLDDISPDWPPLVGTLEAILHGPARDVAQEEFLP